MLALKHLLPAVFVAVTSAAPVAAQDMQFELINTSGYTLMEFYASPSDVGSWQADILGANVLPSGSSGTVTLKEVTVEGHIDRGVDLHGSVVLTADGLTCRGNKSSGVNIKDEAEATIRGGSFTGNTYGIVAAGKSTCAIVGATVSGNTDSGILFAEGAQGTCLDNTCVGNGNGGLRVFGTAHVTHRGNTLKDNVGGGILTGPDAVLGVAPDPHLAPPLELVTAPAGAKAKKARGWFG